MISASDVKKYIEQLNPSIFGFDKIDSIEIAKLPFGGANFNYVAKINNKNFVFKIYIPYLEGLDDVWINSGKSEYLVLKGLKEYGVGPLPVYFDDTKKFFPYEVLVYEYVEGNTLKNIDKDSIKKIAEMFARLHSVDINKFNFIEKKEEDLSGMLPSIEKKAQEMSMEEGVDKERLKIFQHYIQLCKEHVSDVKHPFCLLHTDGVPSNFVQKEKSIKLIDWQSPSISDPAFDVWSIISDIFQQWDYVEPLTNEQKEFFLNEYLKLRDDPTLKERIRIKTPLYIINVALYCMRKWAYVKTGKFPENFLKDRKHIYEKYEMILDKSIDKLKQLFP